MCYFFFYFWTSWKQNERITSTLQNTQLNDKKARLSLTNQFLNPEDPQIKQVIVQECSFGTPSSYEIKQTIDIGSNSNHIAILEMWGLFCIFRNTRKWSFTEIEATRRKKEINRENESCIVGRKLEFCWDSIAKRNIQE